MTRRNSTVETMQASCVERSRIEAVPMFDHRLFRDSIVRERKRTERSGLTMVILLVGVQDGRQQHAFALFPDIGQALSAIKSDIDILGWFEHQAVMGLIVPDVDPNTLAATCERLEASFRREISERCGQKNADRLTIRLRVYPEPHRMREEDLQHVDPYLYPELHANQEAITNFQILKRAMDIVASVLLLMLLAPLLLAIAGIVKLSSRGPVIFRQIRIGQMLSLIHI